MYARHVDTHNLISIVVNVRKSCGHASLISIVVDVRKTCGHASLITIVVNVRKTCWHASLISIVVNVCKICGHASLISIVVHVRKTCRHTTYFYCCKCTQDTWTRITYWNNLALFTVLFEFNVACNSAPYPLHEFTSNVIWNATKWQLWIHQFLLPQQNVCIKHTFTARSSWNKRRV